MQKSWVCLNIWFFSKIVFCIYVSNVPENILKSVCINAFSPIISLKLLWLDEVLIDINCFFSIFCGVPDIRSNDRNLQCQFCKRWSNCSHIWHTRAKTGCWKLDPSIYYGHLSLANTSWYLKVNSKNLGVLFPSSSNASLALLGFIRSWLCFLGFNSWTLLVS